MAGVTGGYWKGVYASATTPVIEFRTENDGEPRVRITPSGVYTGDGTAAPTLGGNQFIRLTSDVTLPDATLISTGLVLPVLASAVYRLEANVVFISPEADDVKVNIVGPSGATADVWIGGLAVASTAATGDADFTSVPINTSTTRGSEDTARIVVPLNGILIVDATAGNVTIQAAKAADAGADGAVKAGSWLSLRRVA